MVCSAARLAIAVVWLGLSGIFGGECAVVFVVSECGQVLVRRVLQGSALAFLVGLGGCVGGVCMDLYRYWGFCVLVSCVV